MPYMYYVQLRRSIHSDLQFNLAFFGPPSTATSEQVCKALIKHNISHCLQHMTSLLIPLPGLFCVYNIPVLVHKLIKVSCLLSIESDRHQWGRTQTTSKRPSGAITTRKRMTTWKKQTMVPYNLHMAAVMTQI